ncbi:MAG: 30S ribosomal protein S1 [Desulfuromonadales bacterium]|nr:30S ribosomal protein S1 [Desulfuromonadales bacterium]
MEYDELDKEESFAELFAASQLKSERIAPGSQIKAKVLHITNEWVFLDVGQKGEGVLDRKEVQNENGELLLKAGDTVSAWFIGSRKGELTFTTKIGGAAAGDRSIIEEAWQTGIPIECLISKEVNGGFEININSALRGFCPYSLIALRRVSEPSSFIGKRLPFKIVEYAENGRNIILSHRAILEEELQKEKETLKESLKPGITVNGVVTSLQKFGAFVKVGAVEGLLPISEISWTKVNNIADILSVGEEVSVIVKTVDWENDKFSFSLKDTMPDPWEKVEELFPEGSSHVGKVVKLATFGAFVTLSERVDGLLHISKLGNGKRIAHPKEVLKEGEEVEVIVDGIDKGNRRISLSLAESQRAAREAEDDMAAFRNAVETAPKTMGTFADLLKKK